MELQVNEVLIVAVLPLDGSTARTTLMSMIILLVAHAHCMLFLFDMVHMLLLPYEILYNRLVTFVH